MAAKKLPIPVVKYVASPKANDKALDEVYALLFKHIVDQKSFVKKKELIYNEL